MIQRSPSPCRQEFLRRAMYADTHRNIDPNKFNVVRDNIGSELDTPLWVHADNNSRSV